MLALSEGEEGMKHGVKTSEQSCSEKICITAATRTSFADSLFPGGRGKDIFSVVT